VLTPQPGAARAIVREALGDAGARVIFPSRLRTQGRTVIARVPLAELGARPAPGWAYSVHVSGARWERSFSVVDRVARGKPAADAFTMPVLPVAEAWAFGGAPEGDAHPQVVDVLLPRGASQRDVLGSFDARSGAYARIPFVGGAPAGPAKLPAAEWSVVDVSGTTVTVSGPVAGLAPMRIGRVLDATGATVARIVVTRVLDAGVVADVLDGGVRRGAKVMFDLVQRDP
jgi:hypothetical protein